MDDAIRNLLNQFVEARVRDAFARDGRILHGLSVTVSLNYQIENPQASPAVLATGAVSWQRPGCDVYMVPVRIEWLSATDLTLDCSDDAPKGSTGFTLTQLEGYIGYYRSIGLLPAPAQS